MKDPEKILQENPGSVLFARYAEELAKDGKTDEAIEILTKGIEANPHYAAGYSVLAEVYAIKELQDESAEQLEKALSLEPNAPNDLFNIGKYLIEKDPQKAVDYLKTALRYEPEDSEIKHALEQVVSDEQEPFDYSLSPDTEDALTQLTEESETTGEDAEIEILSEAESEESAEDAVVIEFEEEQAAEEPDLEDIIEESIEEETEAEVVEDSSEENIPDFSELIEDEEISGEITTEEPEEPSETESEPADPTEPEVEIVATEEEPAATEEPAVEETVEEETAPEVIEEDVADDTAEETVTAEAEEQEIPLETEQEIPPEDEEKLEIEEETTDSAVSDLSGLFEGDETSEESLHDDLSSLIGQVDDDLAHKDISEAEETTDEKSPEYSSLLDEEASENSEPPEQEITETGLLEIDDTGDYDFSQLSEDLTAEEDSEPVLSEEERAELLAIEESPPVAESEEADETKDTREEEESEDSEGKPFDDLYGDLSKDEIDVLSGAETEPDQDENNLETETKEGIDYSDILHGQEEDLQAGNDDEKSLLEIEEQEDKLEFLADSGSVSSQEITEDTTESISEEIESLAAEVSEEPEPMILDIGKAPSDEEVSEPETSVSDEEAIDISEDEMNAENVEAPKVLDYELSDETDKTFAEIENTSLDELIDEYVGAIKDSSEETIQETTDYSVEDKLPGEPAGDSTVEIELDEAGEQDIDENKNEDIPETNEATATMAEIFVSQGLKSRALEIYRTLLKKDPDNEEIKLKIENLEKELS